MTSGITMVEACVGIRDHTAEQEATEQFRVETQAFITARSHKS
jgi:hypothetical protein